MGHRAVRRAHYAPGAPDHPGLPDTDRREQRFGHCGACGRSSRTTSPAPPTPPAWRGRVLVVTVRRTCRFAAFQKLGPPTRVLFHGLTRLGPQQQKIVSSPEARIIEQLVGFRPRRSASRGCNIQISRAISEKRRGTQPPEPDPSPSPLARLPAQATSLALRVRPDGPSAPAKETPHTRMLA